MKYLVIIIFSCLFACLGLLLSLPLFFDGRANEGGIVTRQVEPSVMWGSQETTVTLNLSAGQLPPCSTKVIPMDVVLLLDRSGSMEGVAWQQTIAAAVAFIQNMDLTIHQIGVILFADQAETLVTLNDRLQPAEIAHQLNQNSPGGGTSIATALTAAQKTLLDSQRDVTANRVVILFSDGGDSDPDVLAMTSALKTLGVKIISVGLAGDNFQKDLLEQLATSPNDVYITPDPSKLSTIYEDLANQLNRAIATDVRIIETYNEAAFAVTTKDGEQTPGTLNWYFSSMPDEGLQLTYQAIPQQMGISALSPEPEGVRLKNCSGNLMTLASPVGPYLVLLPEWPWLLLLLLPLLIPLFWWLWQNRAYREGTSSSPSPSFDTPLGGKAVPPQTELRPWYIPAWLNDRLEYLPPPDHGFLPIDSLAETVIISASPASRLVLDRLAGDIEARFGPTYQQKVRLLHIEVQPMSDSTALQTRPLGNLKENQIALLKPDYRTVDTELRHKPEQFRYLRWWQGNSADHYGRAAGRMAIFYDFRNGIESSVLWKRLEETFSGINQPNIWLVVSAYDNFGSGMIADIARLCQLVRNQSDRVSVILLSPDSEVSRTDFDARAKTIATFRELERLMRNLPTEYIYTPFIHERHLNQVIDRSVLGDIIVLDPANHPVPGNELPTTVVNFLLAMLEKQMQSEFDQRFNRARSDAGILANEGREKNQQREFISTVTTIGAYTLQIPIAAVQRILEWQMVHNLLFDQARGLVKTHTLEDASNDYVSRQQPSPNYQLDSRAVDNFLVSIDIDADNLAHLSSAEQQRLEYHFAPALLNHTLELLNGQGLEIFQARSGKLVQVEAFLTELERKLARFTRLSHFKSAHQVTGELKEQVVAWIKLLKGQQTTFGRSSSNAPLWQQWHQAYQVDLDKLMALRQETARQNFVDLTSQSVEAAELGRIMQRIGWLWWQQPTGWQLRLLVVPAITHKITTIGKPELEAWSYSVADSPAILEQLYRLSQSFSRVALKKIYGDPQTDRIDIATQLTVHPNVTEWLEQSQPYKTLPTVQEVTGTPVVEGAFMAIRNNQMRDQLAQDVQHVQGDNINPVKVKLESDPYSCHLVRAAYLIPLAALPGYSDETRRSNYRRDATLHVWPAEQAAVRFEEQQAPFKAEFVALLDNEKLAELFGLALIYGLIVSRNPYKIKVFNEVIWQSEVTGLPAAAMKAFLESDITPSQEEQLRQAIEKQRENHTDDKYDYLQQVEEKIVIPLIESPEAQQDPMNRSFGYFLRGLVKREERT